MLQWYNECVYIHFPSQTLKLSNLEIKIYLPALNLLIAPYLFQKRAYGSRSDTTYKRCFHKWCIYTLSHPFEWKFKTFCWLVQLFIVFHAGSLDELVMLLHQRAWHRTERRVTIKEEPSTSSSDAKLDSLARAMERMMERLTVFERNPPRENQLAP